MVHGSSSMPARQSACELNSSKSGTRLLSDSHSGPFVEEMTASQKSLQHESNYQLIVIASRWRPVPRWSPAEWRLPDRRRVRDAPIWPPPLLASILKVCKSQSMAFPAFPPSRPDIKKRERAKSTWGAAEPATVREGTKQHCVAESHCATMRINMFLLLVFHPSFEFVFFKWKSGVIAFLSSARHCPPKKKKISYTPAVCELVAFGRWFLCFRLCVDVHVHFLLTLLLPTRQWTPHCLSTGPFLSWRS